MSKRRSRKRSSGEAQGSDAQSQEGEDEADQVHSASSKQGQALASGPAQPQVQPEATPGVGEKRERSDRLKRISNWLGEHEHLIQGLGFVLAAIGLFVLGYQSYLMRESNQQTREALEIAQRARLVFEKFDFVELDEPDPAPAIPGTDVMWPHPAFRATAYLKNTGPLTATNVRWFARLTFVPDSSQIWTQPLSEDSPRQSNTVIGSGMTVSIPTIGGRPKGGDGGKLLFFYGRVHYSDGFGHDRSSGFCEYYAPQGDDGPGWKWRPCYYHTWAEEEPLEYRLARDYWKAHPEEALPWPS